MITNWQEGQHTPPPTPTLTPSLQWRHNGLDGISNHQPHHCLLSRLFRRRSKKTSMLRVTGLCAGNSLGTSEFPAQRASNTKNVSIWWRHHADSKVHGANMGPIWGRQDPGGPHVGPMNFAIWAIYLVDSMMSLMVSLVTTSRMQQCLNVLTDIYHEFL